MSKTEYYRDLESQYRKLARRADDRLRALEKLSGQEGFKNVKRYAYARAEHDINKWSGGKGKVRYGKEPPKSTVGLKAKIKDIENFLSMPTSTKTGIIQGDKKRAETLNQRYGTNLSWQDLANFFESKAYKKLSQEFKSSSTAVEMLVSMRKHADLSGEEWTTNIKEDNPFVSEEMIESFLESSGITKGDLY